MMACSEKMLLCRVGVNARCVTSKSLALMAQTFEFVPNSLRPSKGMKRPDLLQRQY